MRYLPAAAAVAALALYGVWELMLHIIAAQATP